MTGPILPISTAPAVEAIRAPSTSPGGASGFGDILAGVIQGVEGLNRNASESVQRLLTGEGEELHTTILAAQRAELAFDMFLQVRNKVVSAYQEIMRMQM